MSGNHPLGTIAHLWRYPIKGLAAEALASGTIGSAGLVNDRASAFFVTTPERPRSGKTYRGKEDPLLHTAASADAARELARTRDIELERRDDGPYFDLDAVSIIFDTWLADLETPLDTKLDPLRFRPNIFARADAHFVARESALVGRTISIGAVRLEITQPITRCITTTYDIAGGASDPRVLAHLARERNTVMGIYARVLTTGTIAPGDVLELEPR